MGARQLYMNSLRAPTPGVYASVYNYADKYQWYRLDPVLIKMVGLNIWQVQAVEEK